MDVVNDSGTGYVVVLTRDDGYQFIAYAGMGQGPAVFDRRRKAVAFRDELWKVHGCRKGTVVKVRYAITQEQP